MKKVLVSGATGFIGNYVLTELLKQQNIQIIATSAQAEKASSFAWFKQVSYKPFNLSDFSDKTNYYDFFERPDAFIHLAWEGLPNYKASFHTEVNYPRHAAFIKNMIHYGLKDITITGTCFEYGMQQGQLTESMEAKPDNVYAVAKNKLREEIQEYSKEKDTFFKWVRLFYMYGKGQNPNSLIPQLEKALLNKEPCFNMSGGEQIRDYLPVEQVAQYITKIALQNSVTGIINCSSNEPISVLHFIQKYLAQKNKTISLNTGFYPYSDYEPMSFWGDNSKLKKIIT
ncbi:MAG: NAD-dependent epimerase/dehydratase family protein [Bacteroidetes bacterium]|nr:NAD-dependent epimerase/dehydratase family protein [Bacteroidota bacterium]